LESYIIYIPPKFERQSQKLIQKHSITEDFLEEIKIVLREDPYNISRRYRIKKLNDIKPGFGQWRIRGGDYRLRYDIFGKVITLYSINWRDKAY